MTRPLSSVGWPKRTQDQIDKQLRRERPRHDRDSPFTEAEKAALYANQSKYRNRPTAYRSIRFGHERIYASKKEMRYAMALDLDPTVAWWLPQPRIPLVGGVTYVADFLIMHRDGSVRFIDTKGRETQGSKNKRKQVAAIYGITAELA